MAKNSLNYDNWFDYIKLEEEARDVDRVREVGGWGLYFFLKRRLRRRDWGACCRTHMSCWGQGRLPVNFRGKGWLKAHHAPCSRVPPPPPLGLAAAARTHPPLPALARTRTRPSSL